MAKKITAIGFAVFFFLSSADSAFGYDDRTTHPALTLEVIEFYNLSGDKISSEEKEWIIEGSIAEDTPPRWINHFYDPVNKQGWSGEKAGKIYSSFVRAFSFLVFSQEKPLSAVDWVKNPFIQEEYKLYGGDRSWQKAMKYYADGNKKEAYKTLGHILHLLEDMAVPDHTRDDTHAPLGEVGGDEGSPYEDYARKYNRETIKNLGIPEALKKENRLAISKTKIDEYLISLAEYSNKYFFSKDTIDNQKYQNPRVIRSDENYGYGLDENNKEFPLAALDFKSSDDKEITKNYSLKDKQEYYPIFEAYFSRLSRQAVLHGAGVIQLFKKKGEEAVVNKDYPVHIVKFDWPKFTPPIISLYSVAGKIANAAESFFGAVGDVAKGGINAIGNGVKSSFSAIAGLFGGGDDFEMIDEVALTEMSGNESDSLEQGLIQKNKPAPKSQNTASSAKKTPAAKKVKKTTEPKAKSPEKNSPGNEPAKKDAKINETDQMDGAKEENIAEVAGNPESSARECRYETTQNPNRERLIINEVAWMGGKNSAADEWLEIKNISGQNILLENWRIIDKGENIKVNLGAAKKESLAPGGLLLLERTDDETVPAVRADIIYTGALSNDNEGLRLFDGECNLEDEALASPKWPAGDSGQKKTMERDRVGFGWHSSLPAGGTPKEENSSPLASIGGGSGGGRGDVSANLASANFSPAPAAQKILITEIQITGGPGKTDNDFVEIFNPNANAINLKGYRLVKRTKTGETDTSIKSWTSDAMIPAEGFYLWANSGYADLGTAPDARTSASLADDNGIAIRFGPEDDGLIIDSAAWGEAQNSFIEDAVFGINHGAGQSMVRKMADGGYIDADDNQNDFAVNYCPSPRGEQSCDNPQGETPLASFIFSPLSPGVSDEVIFDAASSTGVFEYQWDFGDGQGAVSSSSQISHIYSSAGDYSILLRIVNAGNASSAATSVITVRPLSPAQPQASRANHVLISEVYPDKTGQNQDFIEFYNPLDLPVILENYSLEIIKGAATSSSPLASFSSADQIPAKGFFLIGFDNYSSGTPADALRASRFLPTTESARIFLLENSTSTDEIYYDPSALSPGQSLERKAFTGNYCAAIEDAEFSGNGCDTDSSSDFEIRQTANPQNSLNLSEPRNAPAVPQNISSDFSTSTMTIDFRWDYSADIEGSTTTIRYEFWEEGAATSTIATSTEFKKAIDEVGRIYDYVFRAIDRDDLPSATTTARLSVPSFLSSVYVFPDPKNADAYFLSAYYDNYPFVPKVPGSNVGGPSWKLLVFSLNGYLTDDPGWQKNLDSGNWHPNAESVIPVKYSSYPDNTPHQENSLILPDDESRGGTSGGAYSASIRWSNLEDKHFLLGVDNLKSHPKFNSANPEQNYATVAFYSPYGIMPSDGRVPHFGFLAVDKTKYPIGPAPAFNPPILSGPLNVLFEEDASRLTLDWLLATDADTIDSAIRYEIKNDAAGQWFDLGAGYNKKIIIVSTGDAFNFEIRAVDEFEAASATLSAGWSYPSVSILFDQNEMNGWSNAFGVKNWNDNQFLVAQSIAPQNDLKINKVILKINQKEGQLGVSAATPRIRLVSDNGQNQPDIANTIGTATIPDVYKPDPDHPLTFSFPQAVNLAAGTRYWLVLDVESYPGNGYNQWRGNTWETGVASGDVYPDGEAMYYDGGDFRLKPTGTDWWVKLGYKE